MTILTSAILFGLTSQPVIAQGVIPSFFVRAPANISPKELQRLITFGRNTYGNLPVGETFAETKDGDLAIRVKGQGFAVFSKDSELLSTVRFYREMVQLSKKFVNTQLVPISELSEYARQRFVKNFQTDGFNVPGDTCFTLRAMFGNSVQTPKFQFQSATSPSRFGDDKEREKKFFDQLSAKGIVPANESSEREDAHLPSDGVFYDNLSVPKSQISLERASLEILQGWTEFSLRKLDEEIYARYATDPKWAKYLPARTAKTIDELRQLAPEMHQLLLSDIRNHASQLGDASADEAIASLSSAKIEYHFDFTILVCERGTMYRRVISIHW